MSNKIKFAFLENEFSVLPTRKHDTDAGIDLCSAEAYVELWPGEYKIFRTGLSVEIPVGYFGWITNKSKNNFLVGGGIVDQDYQGELLIKIFNVTNDKLEISTGQSIAQLLIIPCITPEVVVVPLKELHSVATLRGKSGGIAGQLEFDSDRFYEESAEALDLLED